jgi:hypothetical protein
VSLEHGTLLQSTGSVVEEEMHDGLVVFAPSSQLAAAAMELLKSPAVRWSLESNARRFMMADHFSSEVSALSSAAGAYVGSATRMSSLALVAKALQRTAGISYSYTCTLLSIHLVIYLLRTCTVGFFI